MGTTKTIIHGLAADRKGGVFLSYGADIYHVDGKIRELIVGDTSLIHVFSGGGQFIASFKNKGSSSGLAYNVDSGLCFCYN